MFNESLFNVFLWLFINILWTNQGYKIQLFSVCTWIFYKHKANIQIWTFKWQRKNIQQMIYKRLKVVPNTTWTFYKCLQLRVNDCKQFVGYFFFVIWIFIFICLHYIIRMFKYEHSNDKEKTSSKWFTNAYKQFGTLHKYSTNVCNCLWTFVNHLLDFFSLSFEFSYLYVCLTFAECSCA